MAETTIGFEPPVVVLTARSSSRSPISRRTRPSARYAQLERARAMTPHDVTEQLIQSTCAGRGGAFFPTGRKTSFHPTRTKVAKPIYLTVNADDPSPARSRTARSMLRVRTG